MALEKSYRKMLLDTGLSRTQLHISWAYTHKKNEDQLSLSIEAKMRKLLDCEAILLLGKPLQIS